MVYTPGCTSVVYIPGSLLKGGYTPGSLLRWVYPRVWYTSRVCYTLGCGIPLGCYTYPFHCWAVLPSPLPVSLLGSTPASSSLLFPFHCWARKASFSSFPFHCWARKSRLCSPSRFTVGLEKRRKERNVAHTASLGMWRKGENVAHTASLGMGGDTHHGVYAFLPGIYGVPASLCTSLPVYSPALQCGLDEDDSYFRPVEGERLLPLGKRLSSPQEITSLPGETSP